MIAHVAFGLVLAIAVPGAADVGTQTTVESSGPGPAAEVNVLWPFIGISELAATLADTDDRDHELELAVTVGVRHESDHPGDGATLHDRYVRAWPMVGYQLDVTPRLCLNLRGGAGLLVYRQSHWDEEKKVAPAVDVNDGCRV